MAQHDAKARVLQAIEERLRRRKPTEDQVFRAPSIGAAVKGLGLRGMSGRCLENELGNLQFEKVIRFVRSQDGIRITLRT